MVATTPDVVAPPDRGWRYHLRHQTPWSRAVLGAGLLVNLIFFIGLVAVLSAHGWSTVCPPDATRLQCATSDPLAEGLQSSGLGLVLIVSVLAAIAVMAIGFGSFRRMPTKSAREAVIVGAVIATQPLVLGGALLWFRTTDVDRFARNFLNLSLVARRIGIARQAVVDSVWPIVRTGLLWAIVIGGLVALYAWWRKVGRRPVIVSTLVALAGGMVWGVVELAEVPSFVKAAQNTLVLSAAGALLGFALGLVLALFSMSRRRVVRAPARIYINFFRGTPLIWQISFAGIGLVPALQLNLSMYTVAILVLGLNLAAYSAEVYRAGIQSLERGQIEAARSVGLTYFQSMRFVVVPQAIRRVIPPLLNEFVILIKDTSLVSVLGLTVAQRELLGVGRGFYSSSLDATYWLGAAAGYLIITIPMIRIVTLVERRLRSGLTSVIG